MTKFIEIVKTVWTIVNSKIFLMGIALLGFVMFLNTCDDKRELEREKIKTDQNIEAMKDSLIVVKKKNGELETSTDAYIATAKELKDLNKSLHDDVEEQKGKVITLSRAVIRLEQNEEDLRKYIDSLETIMGEPVDLGGGVYDVPWQLKYNYGGVNDDLFVGKTTLKLSGDSLLPFIHRNTSILKRVSNISLKFGQEIVDDKLRIFVTSDYPGLTTTSLDGVFIDPKDNKFIKKLMTKRHWFPNTFTFGVGVTAIYDGQPKLLFGPTLSYNLYEW